MPWLPEQGELAAEERGLVARRAEEPPVRKANAQTPRDAGELLEIMVDRPAGPLADEEEP
jgi:hypothetical protein